MRSRWSQGKGPRGTRSSAACAGHRAGEACPTGWIAPGRQAAKDQKEERFTALLHHIDVELLRSAYGWLRKEASAGVDGVTWAAYGEGLEGKLTDLHDRIHRGAYRAQPSRRVYIPKPDGRERPLGIATPRSNCTQSQPTFGIG